MTNNDVDHGRLLPWTGASGQPSLLVSDGDGPVSRIADRVEVVQLGLANRLLGRAHQLIAGPELSISELGVLTSQLSDALHDALLIAECRGARLDAVRCSAPQHDEDFHEVLLAHSSAEFQALAALSLSGTDLASARVARRCVRNMAELQNLPSGAVDDLETITGELAANALEHSDSPTITVALTLAAETATVSVTDEGEGYGPVAPGPTGPRPEEERGRGLLITGVLAARWGRRRTGKGLTVWAEVFTDTSDRIE
ncbi:ATP-binding protein [Streptomyces sp. NPDC047042]|uniref:ATP-binding protein n=1 Tax=Streptomyces sp. NPDC047042 TaxID=3154807 RepID=UPI0033C6930F